MREFFRGWKRKAGCVTLVMACVFMAGWMRSRTEGDLIQWRYDGKTVFRLLSDSECLSIMKLSERKNIHYSITKSHWSDRSGEFDIFVDRYNLDPFVEERVVHFAGFRFREGFRRIGGVRAFDWKVPYWSVVVPLTLLSAYLLLSRPRPAKPSS